MQQLIKIVISRNGRELARCNYIWLDPFAPDAARKFFFTLDEDKLQVDYDDTLHIRITVANKDFGYVFYTSFDLIVLDKGISTLPGFGYWIYGNASGWDKHDQYIQGEIDVFNTWQNGAAFNWSGLPANSSAKKNYISACRLYSGISKMFSKADIYELDLSKVKEERDFIYLTSRALIGEKSYMGHDVYTFEDCILEMFHHNGYFEGRTILFLNKVESDDPVLEQIYEKVKAIFLKFKFSIKYKPGNE